MELDNPPLYKLDAYKKHSKKYAFKNNLEEEKSSRMSIQRKLM